MASEMDIERAGKIFAERMKKYPIDIQIAMGITMMNVMKGCPWGITTSRNREFMNALPEIQKSQNVNAFKISGAQKGLHREDKYLVLVSQQFIINILNKEAGGAIYNQEDYNHAIQKRNSAVEAFSEFLKKGNVGTIGIFNTNEGHSIIADGKNYPAFSVTLNDLLTYCAMYGYSLNVQGVKISMQTAQKNIIKLYESLQVAPNGHALFISITR